MIVSCKSRMAVMLLKLYSDTTTIICSVPKGRKPEQVRWSSFLGMDMLQVYTINHKTRRALRRWRPRASGNDIVTGGGGVPRYFISFRFWIRIFEPASLLRLRSSTATSSYFDPPQSVNATDVVDPSRSQRWWEDGACGRVREVAVGAGAGHEEYWWMAMGGAGTAYLGVTR